MQDKERPKYLLGIDLGLSSSDTDWRSPLLAMLKPRATRNYRSRAAPRKAKHVTADTAPRRPAAPREQEESRYRERSQSRPDPKGKGKAAQPRYTEQEKGTYKEKGKSKGQSYGNYDGKSSWNYSSTSRGSQDPYSIFVFFYQRIPSLKTKKNKMGQDNKKITWRKS